MQPALLQVLFGSRRRVSAEVQQFLDRLVALPSPSRLALYSSLINGLVADGVWAKLDALIVGAAADEGTGLTNLKSSALTPTLITVAGAPTFTADRGWTCVSINRCVSSNFNASTASGNYGLDSAFIGAWSLTAANENSALWRTIADVSIELWPYYGAAVVYAAANCVEVSGTAGANSSGWFVTNRSASNAWVAERNGASLVSSSSASTSLENGVVKVGVGAYQIAAYAIGGSLNATERGAAYARLGTYLQGVGAV